MTTAISVSVSSSEDGYENHNLRSFTNIYGLKTTYSFEKNGNDAQLLDVSGAETTNCKFSNSSTTYYGTGDSNGIQGQLRTKSDAKSVITEYKYDTKNALKRSVLYAKGTDAEREYSYEWHDSFDNPGSEIVRTIAQLELEETAALKSEYFYDDHNNLKKIIQTDLVEAEGYPFSRPARVTEFIHSYTASGETGNTIRSTTTRWGSGSVVDVISSTNSFSSNGYLQSEKGAGETSHYSNHNAWGLPEIIQINGVETVLTYGAGVHGPYLKAVKFGSRSPIEFEYDYVFGRISSVHYPDGRRYRYYPKKIGDVYLEDIAQVWDASGDYIVVDKSRDMDKALLIESISAYSGAGEKTYFGKQEFDALGRLYRDVYGEDETSARDVYTYDANDNLASFTQKEKAGDRSGPIEKTWDYNEHNEPRSFFDGRGTHNFENTISGVEQVSTVNSDRTINTVLSGFGQPLMTDDPNTGLTVYRYNSHGDLVEELKAYNKDTGSYKYRLVYGRDNFGRLTNVISQGDDSPIGNQFWYDNSIYYSTDAACYGSNGDVNCSKGSRKLTKIKSNEQSEYFYYSENGELQTKVVKYLDSSSSYAFGFEHDAATGQLNTIDFPSRLQLRYEYDSAGRVIGLSYRSSRVAGGLWKELVSGAEYYPFGPLKSYKDATGTSLKISRNSSYAVSKITYRDSSISYTYDDYAFTPSRIAENFTDWSISGVYFVALDSAGAVKTYNSSFGPYSLVYDSLGNISDITDDGSNFIFDYEYYSSGHSIWASLPNNRLDEWAFDEVGNALVKFQGSDIHDFRYTALGQLEEFTNTAGVKTNYVYNAKGERVRKTSSALAIDVKYFYDDSGTLIAEFDGRNWRHYIYLENRLVGLVDCDSRTYCVIANPYYVLADRLGTPKEVFNKNGNVVWGARHELYGKARTSGGGFEFNIRFPGQYFDAESGLHYNYYRYYDPSLGRYIQSDPIGLNGGLNTYGYVGGNPLTYSDPTGEAALLLFPGTWAAAAEATAWAAAGLGALASIADSLSKSDKAEKARERKEYSRICKTPIPPTGDPCTDAKNNLNRLKQCLQLRENFSRKWYNDGDGGHMLEIQNTRDGIRNLENWIQDNCGDQCD
ncbi:RHS repeat domain-containing protein [Teredinibacter turnerae]|uniref:RHS repeat domain-containing protein n=1 Tax=Teredinibacter turnerae TaxID=2426 RepID=UPI00036655E8|nr:RHS repeat-associated core domain-containing protein [Teredinibacter turnerae]